MTKPPFGVHARGIGLELQRLRKERKMNCAEVGKYIGLSGSTISRIETGQREVSSEEVAAILTGLEVFGVERERLIDQARRQDDPQMLDNVHSTEQSRNFLNFEEKAIKIIDFAPMLVPGLAQTDEYAHAVLSALRVRDTDKDLEAWLRKRLGRRAILTRAEDPPELCWIFTEVGLRQPIGGAKVMAKQILHLIDLAERENITLNVLPASVAAHPGLLGQFTIMEFDEGPTVVYVEDKTTGLFLDDEEKVDLYMLTAEKLTALALDEQASLRLLKTIARDLERE